MSLDLLMIPDVIEALENFIDRKRPPEEIRDKVDIGYKIDNQSVIIHEIRPRWDDPGTKIEPTVAKATYVKSSGKWNVYWKRADLKWHRYEPQPKVESLKGFLHLVDEDRYGAFWG